MTSDPAEQLDSRVTEELELIADEYKDCSELYDKIMSYVKVVKELETYVINRKV
jgi:hypothetical protein